MPPPLSLLSLPHPLSLPSLSPTLSLSLSLSPSLGPCLSGGNCTNTAGSFTCACPVGTTGHRCQYTNICDSQPCAAGLLCVTTVTNAQDYTCVENATDSLTVTLGHASAGTLDDHVNSLVETQRVSSGEVLSWGVCILCTYDGAL